MTNRQMEILEGAALIAFLIIVALAVHWGNSVGIERMSP